MYQSFYEDYACKTKEPIPEKEEITLLIKLLKLFTTFFTNALFLFTDIIITYIDF